MIDRKQARQAAQDWVDAWNNHDLDRIMRHYTDEVIFWSPSVITRWNIADGKLESRDRLRQHFERGLAAPNIHFELIDVLLGVNGYSIVYRRETGALVVDVVTVDEQGRAIYVQAYYGNERLT